MKNVARRTGLAYCGYPEHTKGLGYGFPCHKKKQKGNMDSYSRTQLVWD